MTYSSRLQECHSLHCLRETYLSDFRIFSASASAAECNSSRVIFSPHKLTDDARKSGRNIIKLFIFLVCFTLLLSFLEKKRLNISFLVALKSLSSAFLLSPLWYFSRSLILGFNLFISDIKK